MKIKNFHTLGSNKGLEILARYRGMQSNTLFAEAFKLEREIED